jgi:hypothetical protein
MLDIFEREPMLDIDVPLISIAVGEYSDVRLERAFAAMLVP